MTVFISRRELLKRAGIVGAAAVIVRADALSPVEASPAGQIQALTTGARTALEHLTAAEAAVLDAVVARLIPTDASGAGALEAGATHYIDHALGGALASSRQAYTAGLAALTEFARASHGKPFTELSIAEQDAVLTEVEAGTATGFAASATFFNLVRTHTIQGTFCDPYYGGNANFIGWDLVGYPGVRTIVTADEQRLGAEVPRIHKSAYDYDMFAKASASLASDQGHHGD